MTLDPITTAIIGFLAGLTVGHFCTKEDMEEKHKQIKLCDKQKCTQEQCIKINGNKCIRNTPCPY